MRSEEAPESDHGLKGEVVEWRDNFDCTAASKNMSANLLTKESKLTEAPEDILAQNDMNIGDTSINEVKAYGQEVRVTNIRNRMRAEMDTDSQ